MASSVESRPSSGGSPQPNVCFSCLKLNIPMQRCQKCKSSVCLSCRKKKIICTSGSDISVAGSKSTSETFTVIIKNEITSSWMCDYCSQGGQPSETICHLCGHCDGLFVYHAGDECTLICSTLLCFTTTVWEICYYYALLVLYCTGMTHILEYYALHLNIIYGIPYSNLGMSLLLLHMPCTLVVICSTKYLPPCAVFSLFSQY